MISLLDYFHTGSHTRRQRTNARVALALARALHSANQTSAYRFWVCCCCRCRFFFFYFFDNIYCDEAIAQKKKKKRRGKKIDKPVSSRRSSAAASARSRCHFVHKTRNNDRIIVFLRIDFALHNSHIPSYLLRRDHLCGIYRILSQGVAAHSFAILAVASPFLPFQCAYRQFGSKNHARITPT